MTTMDPTVRGQQLGDQLRRLREHTSLSLTDAAERIDASASKLSRIETGRRPAPVEDVSALLAIYGAGNTQRRELLALARESERRGWWQRNRPDFPERQRTLIALENKAHHITYFEPVVVSGLLQTGEYTRAIMTESELVPEGDMEQRLLARVRRQSVLLRTRPPKLVAIIDELA